MADSATNAANANHAIAADTATNADHAMNADTAIHALDADHAVTADTCADMAALEARVAALEALLASVSLNGNEVVFSGVNQGF